MTTNEAAARLLGMDYRMVEWWAEDGESYSLVQAFKATDVDKRIAAERRATVERIRDRWDVFSANNPDRVRTHATASLYAILDEEAAR